MHIQAALTIVCFAASVSSTRPSCDGRCHRLVSGPYGVPDALLTASSSHQANLSPRFGRLNSPRCWHPIHNVPNAWIQVRFKHMSRVFKFQTQGRAEHSHWMTSCRVQTSLDCETFTDYVEHEKIRIFGGQHDRHTVRTHILENPVKALCFRIVVLTFLHVPALRFDVIGRRECPSGYVYWGNSCYAVIQDLFSWVDAAHYCKLEGGSLVTVDGVKEHNWIMKLLSEQSPRYTSVQDRNCHSGTVLTYIRGRTLAYCLHQCQTNSACVMVHTRNNGSGVQCWLTEGCRASDLIVKQGTTTHMLMSKLSDVWINMNRLLDLNHWVIKPEQRAKYINWAIDNPKATFLHNCAAFAPSYNYKWINKSCQDRAMFVCEN